jgi:predicted Zn-dependent peptidase
MMMRRALMALVMTFSLAPLPSRAASPVLPTFPPLEFNPPKPERYVLENGLVVYLLEDHELPLIRVSTLHRTGSQYEPVDKVGLSQIFGPAMTLGGSASHSPEDIEKTLDKTAARIHFSVSLESANGSMSCRAENFDQIFGLFADLLLRPTFRKDQVDLQREKSLEALRRMNDEPDDMARREFRALIYGRTHPYARVPSPETLKNVKQQDLKAMHARHFMPNATWIAVSGDFDSQVMKRAIQTAFGAWLKGTPQLPAVPPIPTSVTKGIHYIQRPVNQSQIRVGGLGLERHNPDHFAWEVFNELWGGSAASLLFRTVRTQQGLAYSVGSAFSEPPQKGLVVAVSQTRGQQTIAAVQSIVAISSRAAQAPFSGEEIKWAKEAIRNRFVENFTSSAQIVSEIMGFEYFGFPPDYLDTYTDKIGTVTAADLQRVGRKYLRLDESKILVIGDLSTFEKPISTLGKALEVKPIDYSQETP